MLRFRANTPHLTNRMEDLKRDLVVGRGCRTHNLPLGGSAVCKGEGSKNTHVGHRIPAEADLLPPVLLLDISEFGYFICWSVGSAARRSSLCLVGSTLMYSFTITPCGLMMNVLRVAIVIPFIV